MLVLRKLLLSVLLVGVAVGCGPKPLPPSSGSASGLSLGLTRDHFYDATKDLDMIMMYVDRWDGVRNVGHLDSSLDMGITRGSARNKVRHALPSTSWLPQRRTCSRGLASS